MSTHAVSLAKDGPIATIALERPDNGNLINEQLIQDLSSICYELSDDDHIRAQCNRIL